MNSFWSRGNFLQIAILLITEPRDKKFFKNCELENSLYKVC